MNTFAPGTLEGLHQGKNDPIDFIAAKVFFKEKTIILLNDYQRKLKVHYRVFS